MFYIPPPGTQRMLPKLEEAYCRSQEGEAGERLSLTALVFQSSLTNTKGFVTGCYMKENPAQSSSGTHDIDLNAIWSGVKFAI